MAIINPGAPQKFGAWGGPTGFGFFAPNFGRRPGIEARKRAPLRDVSTWGGWSVCRIARHNSPCVRNGFLLESSMKVRWAHGAEGGKD